MILSALVHFQRPDPTLNTSGSGPDPALAWIYAKAPSTPPRLGGGAYICAGWCEVRCFRGEGTRAIVSLVDEDPGAGGKLTPNLQHIRYPQEKPRSITRSPIAIVDGGPPRPRVRLRVARTR